MSNTTLNYSMKNKLTLLLSILIIGYTAIAQPGAEDRIPERMSMFIRKRMQLTTKEAEQFQPLFARYQKEWREVLRTNKEDRLLQQKELIELQLRYRKEFAPVLGEKRVMEVYHLQEYFIRTLRDIQRDRKLRDREQHRMGPPPLPPPHGRHQEE
jgi:hypothetical protein